MYALTAKGMRYMDRYTIDQGVPGSVLMENAAKSVAEEVSSIFPDRNTKILVLCGSGNNGGDALGAARWLIHLGYQVNVYYLGKSKDNSPEFRRQLRILRNMFIDFSIAGINGDSNDIRILQRDYDVILDGVFGTGLNRRLGSNYVKFFEFINSKKGMKIAIDIPSGLNSTTGQSMNAVFDADETITFSNYKTGMFFADGRISCGKVKVCDIGIAKDGYDRIGDKLFVCDRDFFEKSRDTALLPRPEKSHKGTYGTVGIIVGSSAMMGASMLATKAAYRAGCGLVRIFCPNQYTGFFNVSIPEAVVVPYSNEDIVAGLDSFLGMVDVALIGPGLNEDREGRLILNHLLAKDMRAVLDAGALNLIAGNIKPFKRRRCKCVITPHVGEMAKLCGEEVRIVDKNRIGFAKGFSERYGVSLVLKSDISIISLLRDGEQMLFLNETGNSGLATAGSGDVLSGVIASLTAQGNTLNNSLLYGVMAHGIAADNFACDDDSKRRMMAGDIIDNLF